MGACSISSLRTFYIWRDRRFVMIPANIKNLITNLYKQINVYFIFISIKKFRFVTIPTNIENLITNCVINRLMSILFSFQSRNFIKFNKSKHKLFRCQISDDIVVCFSF